MTRSFAASPDRITRKPSEGPLLPLVWHYRPSAETVITMFGLVRQHNASGTRRVGEGGATDQSNTSEQAGTNAKLEFGTVARAWIVPLERSTRCPGNRMLLFARTDCHRRAQAQLSEYLPSSLRYWKTEEIGLAHIEVEIDWIE